VTRVFVEVELFRKRSRMFDDIVVFDPALVGNSENIDPPGRPAKNLRFESSSLTKRARRIDRLSCFYTKGRSNRPRLVLTAKTAELCRFLEDHQRDPKLWSDDMAMKFQRR